ncbi:hypothetical protein JHD46_05140 [Sulfurimonas sp. SAG-AH-194-C20]|nr:hypothetical protein [Sulfurimonas sp. SAG-AH-194-C20]
MVQPLLKGDDIDRYKHIENSYFALFPYSIKKNKVKAYTEEYIKEYYPKAFLYLEKNSTELRAREKNRFDNKSEWFLYSRNQGLSNFSQNKIVFQEMGTHSKMSYDDFGYCVIRQYSMIKKADTFEDYKYYLSIFNSSLMWFFIKNTSTELRGGYFMYQTKYLEHFPLPKLRNIEQQEPFNDKANLMLELNKTLQETKQNFLQELNLEKIPKKLQNFEELDFDGFVKEYKKAKKLKFSDKLEERNFKNEWRSLFESDVKAVQEIQTQINTTDKEIDKMVYELYGLSDDEISIVESA